MDVLQKTLIKLNTKTFNQSHLFKYEMASIFYSGRGRASTLVTRKALINH